MKLQSKSFLVAATLQVEPVIARCKLSKELVLKTTKYQTWAYSRHWGHECAF